MTREELLKEIKTKEWKGSIYERDRQVVEFCKENLSGELKDDMKLAQVLVLISPLAFDYISPRLQQDDEFIKYLVTRRDFSSRLASLNDYPEGEKILDNKKVVLAAIDHCWPESKSMVLEQVSMRLRNDADVVYAAITSKDVTPLTLATGKLKNNSNFLMKCMLKNPSSVEYFSNEAIEATIVAIETKINQGKDVAKYSEIYKKLKDNYQKTNLQEEEKKISR